MTLCVAVQRYYSAIRSIESVWRAPTIRADHLLLITSLVTTTVNRTRRRDAAFIKRIMGLFLAAGKRENPNFEKSSADFLTMAPTQVSSTRRKNNEDTSLLYWPALSRFQTSLRCLCSIAISQEHLHIVFKNFDVRLREHWGDFIRDIYGTITFVVR